MLTENKSLHLKVNWSFRFLVFTGVFCFSFIFFRYLFESELEYSLFMSIIFGVFQGSTIAPGLDSITVKKSFQNFEKQSSAYLFLKPFFYCQGKIILFDDKFIFLTHKWNSKPNSIEIFYEDIKSVERNTSIISKKGISITTKAQQKINFFYVNDFDECFNLLIKKRELIDII